ncbi:MAG TPA: hypothetical protein VNA19_06705 [Pyrinomonadaceae bacterium]|nr:hypothetical protein [Pyrinomonadaceae bacterium]
MYTNVNLDAAWGVLLLLGFGLCAASAVLVMLHALVTGRGTRATEFTLLLVGGCAVYSGAMAFFSVESRETILGRGEEKYFCEIDCHLAYSVLDVRRAKRVGGVDAKGTFYIVNVRTRFDENTVSPQRGNRPLTPNARNATVLDARGNSYASSAEGERALASANAFSQPFTTPLRPGESYTTLLVFDLPDDIENPRLLINDGELMTRFIIGHENSPLHRKTQFRLEPDGEQAARIAGARSLSE